MRKAVLTPFEKRLRVPLEHLVPSSDDTLFTVGAHARGFGNRYSDIDLVGAYQSRGVPISALSALAITDPDEDGFSCIDFQAHRLADLKALAERLACLSNDDAASGRLTLGDLDLYDRVTNGVPLVNAPVFKRLLQSFEQGTVGRLLGAWARGRCREELHAAADQLKSGGDDVAAMVAARALGHAVDAVLAERGRGSPMVKWRFERLAAVAGRESALFREAWRLKARGVLSSRAYVACVSAFCEEAGIVAAAAVYRPVAIRRAGNVRAFTIADDHVLVRDRRDLYEIDAAANRVWSLIGSEPSEQDLISRFLPASGLPADAAKAALNEVLEELAAERLLASGRPPTRRSTSRCTARIKLHALSAPNYAMSMFVAFLSFSRHYEIACMNILGGLGADQYGLVVQRSWDAIEHGVTAFLASHDIYPASTDEVLDGLARANVSRDLINQVVRLLYENPSEPDEIRRHAMCCIETIEEGLGMKRWRRWGGRNTQAAYDRRAETLRQLAELSEYTGVKGPYSLAELRQLRRVTRFFMGQD
jgi:hypothetical protein